MLSGTSVFGALGASQLLERVFGGRQGHNAADKRKAQTFRAWSMENGGSHHQSSSAAAGLSGGRRRATLDRSPMSGASPRESDEASYSLEVVMQEFHLSNGTLRRMMKQMSKDMDKGLVGGLKTSTIAMLPSFVPKLPDGTEHGRFLAMDLGGTNLRCMLFEIRAGKEPKSSQFNSRIPGYAMSGTGEQLFDFIVASLANFLEEKGLQDAGLSLGFTFSYPCNQTGLRSAKLLRWTKGFNSSGVEGKDVVKILEDAIKRHGGLKVKVVALVNDTVGTQIATAFEYKQCELGVIIATGTNASYMESVSKIPKLSDESMEHCDYEEMIVDTEWGGFGDRHEAEYIKTDYDRIVDERSTHPGVQVFDKLVAGMYMGELVRLVLEKLTRAGIIFGGIGSEPLYTQGTFPTKYISEVLSDEAGTYLLTRQILDELGVEVYSFADILVVREVCMVVSRRSANLAAAAITCCVRRIGKPKITVGVDGSTYKYHPFYHYWVKEKVKELLKELGDDIEISIVQAGDGSGKGAALVAAIAESLAEPPNTPDPPADEQTPPPMPTTIDPVVAYFVQPYDRM